MTTVNSTSRTPENGSLKFNAGTEDRLADYVLEHAEKGNPDSVIKAVNEFCWNEHWMMHLGDEKGAIVENEVKQHNPKIILELGTYCAFSTILMARHLPKDGRIYTIDPEITMCSIKLIQHSGLEDKIFQVKGKAQNVISKLPELRGKVDMVFIDHAKNRYLPDLLIIEQAGFLHPGSVVVADNVIIFHIDDYLKHVRTSGRYSSSVNHLANLEYDDTDLEERVDGVEVSIYK